MKVNTKDTDSLFKKSFAKYPFNSEKKTKTLMPDRFKKSFSFSIYSTLFKKAVEVLAFCISVGSNSMCHVLQGAVNSFTILFRARNYPNSILHIILKQAPQFCLQENCFVRRLS